MSYYLQMSTTIKAIVLHILKAIVLHILKAIVLPTFKSDRSPYIQKRSSSTHPKAIVLHTSQKRSFSTHPKIDRSTHTPKAIVLTSQKRSSPHPPKAIVSFTTSQKRSSSHIPKAIVSLHPTSDHSPIFQTAIVFPQFWKIYEHLIDLKMKQIELNRRHGRHDLASQTIVNYNEFKEVSIKNCH